ncbi:MAG: LCP family protein, partial [Nocardioides sp.]|nr:LCP family protein [Nocardioides sp.]
PPPLAPPPASPTGAGGPTKRGRPRARQVRRVILALLVAWLAFLVIVPFLAWGKVTKTEWEPSGQRPAASDGENYLLVGSDSRADLSAEERRTLTTGNPEGQRTDTIMLLHTGSGPNLLMSIPRDSLVDIPGRGESKINAAFAFGGAPLLVQTLEQSTGIHLDGYVEIGLGGVVDMVDAVGGVEICPNKRMRDPLAGLDVQKGCQGADGTTALAYARSRKTNLKLGDVARARQQREVVKGVGRKALSPMTVLNPFRYYGLNMAVPAAFSFGEGMGKVSAGRFALALSRVNGGNGLTCGVPIRDLAVNWDEERSQSLFAKIIADDTESVGKDLCNPSGLPQ